jgi:sphinganine-1-phosphate aldolase
MLGIRLVKVAMKLSTMEVDLDAVRSAIGPNTIMLYGSAPSYPYGTIDPISELSKIAKKYNIGLHVDCCLGGFVLPFAKQLGYDIPGMIKLFFLLFEFKLTYISCIFLPYCRI